MSKAGWFFSFSNIESFLFYLVLFVLILYASSRIIVAASSLFYAPGKFPVMCCCDEDALVGWAFDVGICVGIA